MEPTTQKDEHWMGLALAQARQSVGVASPNPAVGCVVMRDGEVIGEGFHAYDELDHAEVVALRRAGERAHGSTAYVTLEPCSHQGRTGPCADALIQAGVARVVAATLDPNPLVSGNGIAKLRSAGIEAVVGVCEQEAREVNEGFAKFIRTRLPLVTLKAALSRDGKIAPQEHFRGPKQPHWLTAELARAEVQRLRHGADAVLTGIGTALADDPRLSDRSGLERRRPLLRVVLDAGLRLPLDSQLARTARQDLLVFCGASAAEEKKSAIEALGARVQRIGACSWEGSSTSLRLDLREVLAALAELQVTSALVEGGTQINGAFLREGLVDRLVLFYAPMDLGEDALAFAEGCASPYALHERLQRASQRQFGADRCVSGLLHDPWAAE